MESQLLIPATTCSLVKSECMKAQGLAYNRCSINSSLHPSLPPFLGIPWPLPSLYQLLIQQRLALIVLFTYRMVISEDKLVKKRVSDIWFRQIFFLVFSVNKYIHVGHSTLKLWDKSFSPVNSDNWDHVDLSLSSSYEGYCEQSFSG